MSETIESRNKALVLKAFDALFNQRDYAAAERFWSANYIQHSAHIAPGREGLLNLIKSLPPTLKYESGTILAEGDLVAANTLSTGTHDGVFEWYLYGPWPASGRQIKMREIFIIRLLDGKIADMTATWNPDESQATARPEEPTSAGVGVFPQPARISSQTNHASDRTAAHSLRLPRTGDYTTRDVLGTAQGSSNRIPMSLAGKSVFLTGGRRGSL